MIGEKDLLSAYVHFDPPLYNKRAREHQVYLIPRSGSILRGCFKGIVLRRDRDKVLGKWSLRIDVPLILVYENRPEYEIKEFPIRELTKESLRYRVQEAFEQETCRLDRRPL